ncbi:MAG TPA: hypothetical protein VNU21_15165, partial [Usitatibacter sp.]|nr:hypothetical protein [Usitatibacter sp.]
MLAQARLFAILPRVRGRFLGREAPLDRLGQLLLALGAALGGARRGHRSLRGLPRVFRSGFLGGERATRDGVQGLLGGDAFGVRALGGHRFVMRFLRPGKRLLFFGRAACSLRARGGLGCGALALAACDVRLRLGAGFRLLCGARFR